MTDGSEGGPQAASRARYRPPFAARVQGLLIVAMFVALAMITQQVNKSLYRIGLPVLIVAAFLQIAFGNIPPRSNFRRSMVMLAVAWTIMGALFFASVKLAPRLIEASR